MNHIYRCLTSIRTLTGVIALALLPGLAAAQSTCCCGSQFGDVCLTFAGGLPVEQGCLNFGGTPILPVSPNGGCVDFPPCNLACAGLPVELLSFDAKASNGAVLLEWSTASETNNAGFDVEHEAQGAWHALAFVTGHGTTTEAQHYRYDVTGLDPGLHRFRLNQIDFDGTSSLSHVVEVTLEVPGRYVMKPAYPNPFNPSTTLTFAVSSDQFVRAVLYDVLGRVARVAYAGQVEANRMQTVRISAGGLPSGAYHLRLEGEGFQAGQRVVLLQ